MLALVGGRALARLGGIVILTNSNETTNTKSNIIKQTDIGCEGLLSRGKQPRLIIKVSNNY